MTALAEPFFLIIDGMSGCKSQGEARRKEYHAAGHSPSSSPSVQTFVIPDMCTDFSWPRPGVDK